MPDRFMGMEAELAFSVTGPNGEEIEPEDALGLVHNRVRERIPHLPAIYGGVFLANGGRLYLDNNHDEWCTPESTCPATVVRHLFAGERMLADAARSLVRDGAFSAATFRKVNVDYSGTQSAWGAHESYSHTCDPDRLPPDLIPFLASRLVVSGAGGFDAMSPTGCFFTLSPRASFIRTTISGCSTQDRGIYHTRDEPLAGTGHRLHVLVGESLCSASGNWLKLATTALCVAMADADLRPGRGVALQDPVRAMRAFAADPTCKATARSNSGRNLTAIAIQRHYLDQARRQIATRGFPAWTGQAVHEWDAILTRLEHGPAAVAETLDWGIKHAIYGSWLQTKGFTWDSVQWWSHVQSILKSYSSALPENLDLSGCQANYICNPDGPLAPIVRALTPHLRARDMNWPQYDQFQKVRLQLFELDTRFGELGPDGIFNSLDAAGALKHAFPGVDRIDDAMTEPPAEGRSSLRGRMVRQLHGHENRYICYWDRIVDQSANRMLDLSDPSKSVERWRDLTGVKDPLSHIAAMLTDAIPI